MRTTKCANLGTASVKAIMTLLAMQCLTAGNALAQITWADVEQELTNLDLQKHERRTNDNGDYPGHTISRHVQCSDAVIFGVAESGRGYCSEQALVNRCVYEIAQGNTFKTSSSYGSMDQAIDYVKTAMRSKQATLLTFLNGPKWKTELTVLSSNWYFSSGRAVDCANTASGAFKVKGFSVFLRKSSQMPQGWYIHTSFPTP
jgi:hypothetical protein